MTPTRPWVTPTDIAHPLAYTLLPAAAATALTLALTWQQPAAWPTLLLFCAGSTALAVIDLDVQRLPIALTWATIAATALSLAITLAATGHSTIMLRCAATAALTATGWWALAIATGGIGYGDVRLSLLTGGITGWASWGAPFTAAAAALILGGLCAITLKLLRPTITHQPFGPALLLGALIALWLHTPLPT